MKIVLAPGKYVVAVSGGVDSMVLLHMLAGDVGFEPGSFTVAHFDHGIRTDSAEDRQLVQATAEQLGLAFVYKNGKLGVGTSEALAREHRYAFLREAAQDVGAQGIITAHHQDDLLETVVHNLLRGTGRKGLSSLRSRGDIIRPLLHVSKAELLQYAQTHDIHWREDSTNADRRYRRNQIRQDIMPRLDPEKRAALQSYAAQAQVLNDEIDDLLDDVLRVVTNGKSLQRSMFIQLPHAVSCEVLAEWLRRNDAVFDRRSIERLVVFVKTALPSKRADVDAAHLLMAGKKHITLEDRAGKV